LVPRLKDRPLLGIVSSPNQDADPPHAVALLRIR
jgi:hypothetical protein